ncbi:uncharacterized protein LOC124657345 [Lolium rigidum]|uniref:uncharacterized protein LOC124657345 n=1 Tax=Lolium rigidum TaxID=89674 RepID=UPI001F5C83A8|nr:uncharacterized protein LOC124657345 [Lolium rigidum]
MKKKKIVKEESKPAPQATGRLKLYAARRGRISRRQDTVGEAAAPIKEHADSKGELGNERRWQKRTCSFCGVSRIHENDHFCPYNYINGDFNLSTCRARCQPGKHPLLLASSSGSGSGSHHLLRRLVRVTNVALSTIPGESDLCRLFRRFGPLVGSNLTSMSLHDPVGFGWVVFESREHAEEAIDKLNGHLVGDRKLRVDWVYPQT